jgi:hypothetical protein
MNDHRFETHKLIWRGITIEVTYEAHWLRREGFYCPCHLALTTIEPERCPLPLNETGYLSHFTDPIYVERRAGHWLMWPPNWRPPQRQEMAATGRRRTAKRSSHTHSQNEIAIYAIKSILLQLNCSDF